jgi:hypothetical protein
MLAGKSFTVTTGIPSLAVKLLKYGHSLHRGPRLGIGGFYLRLDTCAAAQRQVHAIIAMAVYCMISLLKIR